MLPRLLRTASLAPAHLMVRHSSTSASSKASRFVTPLDAAHIPRGFAVSTTYAGIKKAISPNPTPDPTGAKVKPDLALITSTTDRPAAAAGTFTRNVFKAAPVVLSSRILASGAATPQGARARSVLVNSGCANAVTGQQGLDDAQRCGDEVQALLRHKAAQGDASEDSNPTLLLSTGVIGVPLPMPAITAQLPAVAQGLTSGDAAAWHEAARAFMTTDTFPKLRARAFALGDTEYRLLGIDKGAGMIHPSMGGPALTPSPAPTTTPTPTPASLHATLLGFVATDAPISPPALQAALEHAVSRSFNCISVDGDMSTNDTIIALANGAGAPASSHADTEIHPDDPLFPSFQAELTSFCKDLAQLVVRDGEGAEKFVQVHVKGAGSYDAAHAIASSVSTSALVKCALHGSDANWGRILCAVGYAPLPGSEWEIDPQKVTVRFLVPPSASGASDAAPLQSLTVLQDGTPLRVDEAAAHALLSLEDIHIEVDLQGGRHDATYWTCDFSKEYVAINGDYRS